MRKGLHSLALYNDQRTQSSWYLNRRVLDRKWNRQSRGQGIEHIALDHNNVGNAVGGALTGVGKNIVLGHFSATYHGRKSAQGMPLSSNRAFSEAIQSRKSDSKRFLLSAEVALSWSA